MRIIRDSQHPLHAVIKIEKGNRLKRGKSWLGRAEDTVSRVCPPTEIVPGEEWVRTASVGNSSINVLITLRKANKNNVGSMINSEIRALVDENSTEDDIIIFTDGSVVRHLRSSWAFTAQRAGRTIHEESGAYKKTTSSLTMEVVAVTKAMA